ncbi:Long-chain-fatty-acid--CoA ligase 1 [Bagarius yarrelli]|uniref:long-chain-fatty-acid--CoA ligase n=1 Tax=Bagarius yarrelli TaxID=175774 RepID=A0A556UZR7_BAGYA|nr:Long-chain-fatty-acid--CoA ligase 1 [Bagarius yarrelli]
MGAAAALTTFWYTTRPKAIKPPCDLRAQSVEVPVAERAECLGSALLHKGHSKTKDQFIGIFSQSRPEWTITEMACYTYSLVSVPLYDTLGTEAIDYIISKRNPKGAMLTHRNIVSNISAFVKITETSCPLTSRDSHISYLPLAHMFERVVQGVMLVHGGRIGYFKGDIRCLMDDLMTLRPTVFPVVPRLLNRMFDKIFGQANTPLKKWILEFAFRRKEAEMKSGIMRRNSLWDKLIFKKVQASVGGNVRLMLTGAAPVSAHVLTFLRAALGCQVCVKGPNVFRGYLKDQEKTEEAIDPDGWLHTGDIGRWLPNGTLKIVDRKKHIFKLAQGEYIAPEKIENIYIRSEAVVQAFVHGDSLQACLVAILVPDPDFLPGWASKRGFRGSYEELCNNKDVKNAILEEILKLGKENGLKSFEQVKDIALHTELFSIQNGLLTPTLKAKRAELRTYFRQQIDQLYSKIHM